MADELELLAVTLVDIRASADQLKRSVTNAQASVEQFRHRSEHDRLLDIVKCLEAMEVETKALLESAAAAREPLDALLRSTAPPQKPKTKRR